MLCLYQKSTRLPPSLQRNQQRTRLMFRSFTEAIEGISAEPIKFTEGAKKPFEVSSKKFKKKEDAVKHSCDTQNTACKKKATDKHKECDAQKKACIEANA